MLGKEVQCNVEDSQFHIKELNKNCTVNAEADRWVRNGCSSGRDWIPSSNSLHFSSMLLSLMGSRTNKALLSILALKLPLLSWLSFQHSSLLVPFGLYPLFFLYLFLKAKLSFLLWRTFLSCPYSKNKWVSLGWSTQKSMQSSQQLFINRKVMAKK